MSEKLWSVRVAQDPGADPIEREILQRRLGNAVIIILPTSDGRFALLSADRQLIDLRPNLPSAAELTELSTNLEVKFRSRMSILRAEGAFYGEPNDIELSRGIRRALRDPGPIKVADW